jgi:nicotinate-nucleotide pyrophosphorylase (carboxylating)
MDWHSRRITSILENALIEDRAIQDATTTACIEPKQLGLALIRTKQDCVLAGLGAITRILEIFASLDRTVEGHPQVMSHPEIFDGVKLAKGAVVASIRHNARVILSCERVMLNLLQRLSGTATLTRKFVDAIAGTKAKILDTRKTVLGLRVLDKYAVRCGGGQNHRLDLSDGILIKNNHIALAGGIRPALERVHRNRQGNQPIEIEVKSLKELDEAIEFGAEGILVDNMTPEMVREAVDRVAQTGKKLPIECSGGIRLENVRSYAETGVDFISVGVLTHSPIAVDMNLRVEPA